MVIQRVFEAKVRNRALKVSRTALVIVALLMFGGTLARADQTILEPIADNTIYSGSNSANSFGAGPCILAGKSGDLGGYELRRALIRFDVSSVPAGAVVTGASLQLYFLQGGGSGNASVSLHRLHKAWGEGLAGLGLSCGPGGPQGRGKAAGTGDATWTSPLLGTNQAWEGGDYEEVASSQASIDVSQASTRITWSGPDVARDVQGWISDPSSNDGWILRGDESATTSTVRQFASRENSSEPHPVLTIYFSTPEGACCSNDGLCKTLTEAECHAQGGSYQGTGTTCVSNLCPIALEPYVDALPVPAVAQPIRGKPGHAASYVISMREFKQKLHRDLPPTTLWGYDGQYPGPTIESSSDEPVRVRWANDLRDEFGNLRTRHYLPVDMRLHGPDAEGPDGPKPRTVVHLHGAHVEAAYDGYPESTFVAGESRDYVYSNKQRGCTLWYHDHALGITRLNVMMGLAGFYLIRDAREGRLGLPSGPYEIPLLVQDRKFNSDGSLFYPTQWTDDFMGDKVLVNGRVWPYLRVARGKYRFRLLNGSNHRIFTFALSDGGTFHLIGTDGGLLAAPVPLTEIRLAPAERADLVIDFSAYAPGTEVLLQNTDPSPTGPDSSARRVMKFIVGNESGCITPLPVALASIDRIPESEAVRTRSFELTAVADPLTGKRYRLGGLDWGDISEYPVVGSTEIWSFINHTGETHPIHIHLVQFQVLDRQAFTVENGQVVPVGPRIAPPPEESGYKDTAKLPTGQILRVIARFTDYTGDYVFHCHMLEHEDNDMMRQFTVLPHSASVPQSTAARAEPSRLWPPDGGLASVRIVGVTDSDGNPATIHITGITQDEPISGGPPSVTNSAMRMPESGTSPATEMASMRGHGDPRCIDARIDSLGVVSLRRARLDMGNGRVYRIRFVAVDARGGSSEGTVLVSVPRTASGRVAMDEGQDYNSLLGCEVSSGSLQEMGSHSQASSPSVRTALRPPRLQGRNAVIEYSLAEPSEVAIALYDVSGRRVAGLDEVMQEAGKHTQTMTLRDMARGVYFVQMRAEGKSYNERLLVIGSER